MLAKNRTIPLTTRCCLLFGGIFNQFGWAFFGFGLIFFWVFGMNADMSFLHFSGKMLTVNGIITDSINTNASENNSPIYEHHFSFTADNEDFDGVSFATGKALRTGAAVTVEYPKGKPQYARIAGMRRRLFGPFALVVLLFPFIGLMFILFGLKKSLRTLRILRHGQLTTGKLVAKAPTRTRINNQLVYKLTFRFTDSMGSEHDVSTRTHLPHLLEDDAEERLIYLTQNPAEATMLDSLPGASHIREDGTITAVSAKHALLCSIVPLLTIIGHAIYIDLAFFR